MIYKTLRFSAWLPAWEHDVAPEGFVGTVGGRCRVVAAQIF